MTKPKLATIKHLLEAGLTYEQISARTGINNGNISRFAQRGRSCKSEKEKV
jgi:uncharacterized protein YerC